MAQAERLTLLDAQRWASWQTERTGEKHVVYRREPVQRASGLAGLTQVLARFYVRPESAPAPEGAVRVEETQG